MWATLLLKSFSPFLLNICINVTVKAMKEM